MSVGAAADKVAADFVDNVRQRTLDALREGYQVYVVADAIGGVSPTAHNSAMQRMIQAGAIPISVLGLACELQRDWGRPEAERLRMIMREYFGKLKHLKD